MGVEDEGWKKGNILVVHLNVRRAFLSQGEKRMGVIQGGRVVGDKRK